jgi:hypothetical protein
MTMHVLISVVFAVLMQTPGVRVDPIDAAMSVGEASVSHAAGTPIVLTLTAGRTCPCRRHHAH